MASRDVTIGALDRTRVDRKRCLVFEETIADANAPGRPTATVNPLVGAPVMVAPSIQQ